MYKLFVNNSAWGFGSCYADLLRLLPGGDLMELGGCCVLHVCGTEARGLRCRWHP